MQNRLHARRMHQFWEDENFVEALPLACEMIALDDAAQADLAQQCLMVIMEASERLRTDPGHERIGRLIEDWMARAVARRKGRPKDETDYATVSDEELAKTAEFAGLAQARMILGPLGGLQPNDGNRAVALMDELLHKRPGLIGAHFCRAFGWLTNAKSAATQGLRDAHRSALEHIVADASFVAQNAIDPSLRKRAQQLRQQVESHR
jgi:hypothetical protein